MQNYLVLFMAPNSVMKEWMQKPEEERKAAEEKMRGEWQQWMSVNAASFVEAPAGAGKAKRVTTAGAADESNDIMMAAIIKADSTDAAAAMVANHPHLGIPEAWIEIMPLKPVPTAG